MNNQFRILVLIYFAVLVDFGVVIAVAKKIPKLRTNTITNCNEHAKTIHKDDDGPGEPLILTPFLKAGNVNEARDLSFVQNITDVVSYSGYFTVNEKYNSNMFFWFFPAAFNPGKAPVVVWLQGGPGATSLFGLFVEHGPFSVDGNNNLQLRNTAWSLTHSVIYFDNPVATGFSFTEDDEGYAKNQEDVARDLYEALLQFFMVFPEYRSRDFYVMGESYAGKYVPALSYKIHTENRKFPVHPINFKGMLVGDGLSDPITMMYYGDYLYNVGLIDQHQKLYFEQEEAKIRDYIRKEKWMDAFKTFDSLILCALTGPGECYFENATGFQFHYNILISSFPADQDYFADYVQLDHVRRSLHVGNTSFVHLNKKVKMFLREDMLKSVKPWLEELLDAEEGYKILYYSGQLDVIVANTNTDRMLRHLKWNGAEEFAEAPRKIWRVGGTNNVAGYVKTTKNFTHLLFRNAGHMSPKDQPKHAFDMLNRFTSGKLFA